VALNSTIHTFDIDLSDVDRGVYEALALRVARHPSESEEYLVTRVLAYCLEYAEGIGFSNGLAEPEEPTLFVRDLTGKIRVWIDIGAPDAARMHKAGKAAARVVVYTHRDPEKVMRQWSGERIHHAEALELYSVAPALVAAFVARLERRMTFALSVTSGHLYLTIDDEVLEGPVERHAFSG
jgi:uncharacterized protein YaeQ